MAVMTAHARVNGCTGSRFVAAALLVGFGVLAAAMAGGALGAIGGATESSGRWITATVGLAVIGGCLASDRPWQVDYETPGSWLRYRDWRTAALNGVALGLGAGTRLGFWLWYVVPIAAWATGSAAQGAAIYSVYASTRLILSATPTHAVLGRLSDRSSLARALDPLCVAAIAAIATIAIADVL